MAGLPAGVAGFVAGIVFGAGGAWAVLQRMRRDLNGLGRAYRRDVGNLTLWLLTVTERREDRELLARLLRM